MYLILEFDLNMDLINVPAHIVTDKEEIRHKFLNWVYSSTNRKKYTKRRVGCVLTDSPIR